VSAKTNHGKVAQTLHVWTGGERKGGVGGEKAEVTAPGWLLNEDDTDPETYSQQLAAFKERIVSAFAIIWDERPRAAYDFELDQQRG